MIAVDYGVEKSESHGLRVFRGRKDDLLRAGLGTPVCFAKSRLVNIHGHPKGVVALYTCVGPVDDTWTIVVAMTDEWMVRLIQRYHDGCRTVPSVPLSKRLTA